MNKKSQLEILGLAIVVMLLSFGLLLVFMFVLQGEDEEPIQKSFRESQLASNIVSSILRTDSGCARTDMTELLQDCATTKSIWCSTKKPDGSGFIFSSYFSSSDVVDSCKFASAALKYLFNSTVEEWKQDYIFKLYLDPTYPAISLPISAGSGCPGDQEIHEQPLPASSGQTIYVSFAICT